MTIKISSPYYPYRIAWRALRKAIRAKGSLTEREAEDVLGRTPGLCFAERVAEKDIIELLCKWGLLQRKGTKLVRGVNK